MVAVATDIPVPAGLVLTPFRAVRSARLGGADLAVTTSPPYDVIDAAGIDALEAADPHNVVRLILPRDLDGAGAGAGSRYGRAAQTLADWLGGGVLARDETPALYVYEEEEPSGHIQRGLVGAVALADPHAGIILPHEDTIVRTVTDRLALTRATRANLEPIFLLYEGGGPASDVVAATVTTVPEIDIVTDDGVGHRIWALRDPETLAAIADDLLAHRAVIADGHHRYATYRHYQAEHHAAGDGPGPWDYGLAFLVDANMSGPQVHAIHRSIRGLPAAEAARRAEGAFAVRALDLDMTSLDLAASPADPAHVCAALLYELTKAGQDGHAFVVADARQAFLLTDPAPALLARTLPAQRSAAFRGLGATVAHLSLIVDVWGLEDAVGVVDYHHEALPAFAAAAASGGSALLLNATPVADITAVAAAGERMPRKSTLFTPKPRTGLLMRLLDE